MYVSSTQDFMYLAIGIAVLWVGGMLCWALYELGRLLHQANETVEDARDKVKRVEAAVMGIKDKLESVVSYAGVIAQGGKAIASYFGGDGEEGKKGGKKKKKSFEEMLGEE
jgi:hypothetical protein